MFTEYWPGVNWRHRCDLQFMTDCQVQIIDEPNDDLWWAQDKHVCLGRVNNGSCSHDMMKGIAQMQLVNIVLVFVSFVFVVVWSFECGWHIIWYYQSQYLTDGGNDIHSKRKRKIDMYVIIAPASSKILSLSSLPVTHWNFNVRKVSYFHQILI